MLNPTVERLGIHLKTTFQHHFRQITIADPVFAIPPDTNPESSPHGNAAA